MPELRDYQLDAYNATFEGFETYHSVLCTMATGLGKTIYGSEVANDWRLGRVMFLAHRDELIQQSARKIYEASGEWPAIEQGQLRSPEHLRGRSPIVVASVQSLHARRLERFRGFGLVIADEAHHAGEKNRTYGQVIDHLRNDNPELRVLGITATPMRHDKQRLIFEREIFNYGLPDAIRDGWLCRPDARAIVIESLDLGAIPASCGNRDFDLLVAQELERDSTLHGMADAIIREAEGRQTLVFCASLKQAEELSRILNGYRPGRARWLSGDRRRFSTETRRQMLRDFENGEYQYLLNMGVLTEGFDSPRIQMIAMARPTRSTSLAMQMLGRGTRTWPGVVDQPGFDAQDRLAAISNSPKPDVKVIDFVDLSRAHKIITTTDLSLLGGEWAPEVVDQVREIVEANSAAGRSTDVAAEAERVRERLNQLAIEREAQEAVNAERHRQEWLREREAVYQTGAAQYAVETVDLLDPYAATSIARAPELEPPTEKQVRFLRRNGHANAHLLSKREASREIGKLMERFKNKQRRRA
jgi:superfamily II DNA or RNA helicase